MTNSVLSMYGKSDHNTDDGDDGYAERVNTANNPQALQALRDAKKDEQDKRANLSEAEKAALLYPREAAIDKLHKEQEAYAEWQITPDQMKNASDDEYAPSDVPHGDKPFAIEHFKEAFGDTSHYDQATREYINSWAKGMEAEKMTRTQAVWVWKLWNKGYTEEEIATIFAAKYGDRG